MRKYFVGLDVHLSRTNACILDAHGKKVKQLTVRGAWTRVIDEPAKLQGNLSVCYEASRGYSYLYDQLGTLARRVVVAHPGQLRLIFRPKRKNDRVDARKPAKLLFLDEAPTVFVPSQNVRAGRQLIEVRVRLVNKRTQVKHSRPKRFHRTRSIGVYLVLIPCQNESGTASYFVRIERGKQDRGKIAIVATERACYFAPTTTHRQALAVTCYETRGCVNCAEIFVKNLTMIQVSNAGSR